MVYSFTRTEWLVGKDAINKLAKSKVAIFGIGGVGSYVAEGLVRSGVGSFVLIDSDDIHVTNLNRQIHATVKTVGRPKVEVMKERMLDINPNAEIAVCCKFYTADSDEDIFQQDWDYIVDAIDTVSSKIHLVTAAKERCIPIISSMGAGNKLDPTKFRVADIYSTSVCPLAKIMRKELRRRNIESLKVVYSTEMPVKPLCTVESDENIAINSTGPCSAKKCSPGSISFVPSVVGMIIAGEVVKDLMKE
jgi:tRNA A37 threonylcarbamoyladenosine dehydratase